MSSRSDSKHVDIADLSVLKRCWARVGWYCISCRGPCTEMLEGDKVEVDGIYLDFDYICLGDTHTHPSSPVKKLRVETHLLRNETFWSKY